MVEKVSISVPYMHPVCPISLNHARLFVMADTFARYERSKGSEVYFPLGLHYSGIEPITLSRDIRNNRGNRGYLSSLARKFSINEEEISRLDDPLSLLDFFSNNQKDDLRSLGITCNISGFYNTKEKEYERFVEKLFDEYK